MRRLTEEENQTTMERERGNNDENPLESRPEDAATNASDTAGDGDGTTTSQRNSGTAGNATGTTASQRNSGTTRSGTSSNRRTTTIVIMAPKFGGVEALDDGKSAPWLGGGLNYNLTRSVRTYPASPYCFRRQGPKEDQASYRIRVLIGCSPTFKLDNPDFSIESFICRIIAHFETHGIDSVFYVLNNDGTGADYLLTHYMCHTLESVSADVERRKRTFDQYALDAMFESGQWLLNSLDEGLKQELENDLLGVNMGPQIFMVLVGRIYTESLGRTVDLQDEFRALNLETFPGENVPEYCNKASSILVMLERERQLPPLHLVTILDVFTFGCSVDSFKVQFMARRDAIETFAGKAAGKTGFALTSLPNYIHFQTLLKQGTTAYRNLRKHWTPATAIRESAPVTGLVAQIEDLQARLAAQDQRIAAMGNNPPANQGGRTCSICGEAGHQRHACPFNFKNLAVPGPNDPLTKTLPNGRGEIHFCATCVKGDGTAGAWNKSHTTPNHTPENAINIQERNRRNANRRAGGGANGGDDGGRAVGAARIAALDGAINGNAGANVNHANAGENVAAAGAFADFVGAWE
ncbi:MAG: hypothetical protein GY768_27730 [Planctomycetaceae bacterium]|nr:hypothetical protein [Planctomycetaceae bacterium]